MKKRSVMVVCVSICVFIAAALICFFCIREANYACGREQGYLAGYSVGYIDKSTGRDQKDRQVLAGSIVPYEFGSSKWKGFMIGFPDGYSDGYSYTSTNGNDYH